MKRVIEQLKKDLKFSRVPDAVQRASIDNLYRNIKKDFDASEGQDVADYFTLIEHFVPAKWYEENILNTNKSIQQLVKESYQLVRNSSNISVVRSIAESKNLLGSLIPCEPLCSANAVHFKFDYGPNVKLVNGFTWVCEDESLKDIVSDSFDRFIRLIAEHPDYQAQNSFKTLFIKLHMPQLVAHIRNEIADRDLSKHEGQILLDEILAAEDLDELLDYLDELVYDHISDDWGFANRVEELVTQYTGDEE